MNEWKLLGTTSSMENRRPIVREHWQHGEHVYRRIATSYNYLDADGAPVGARYEGSRGWFDQWVAPHLDNV